MIRKSAAPIATAVLAGALMVGLFAAPAQAALRHIDGTVVSKNSDNRSFKITTQNGNQVRIKVNGATEFERIAGFGALHKGMRVEVDAQQTDSGLLAKQVEPQGGGGGGGSDDGPNHT
jgi:cold shock CspA family protein